jgi:branched-chain amino acid transport system substrate-binding protein
MTGPDAPFGDKFKKAYGLAVEEINAKGGVNGKKIEVIVDHPSADIITAKGFE